MFTGLVEGRGIVSEIRSEGAAIRLVVAVPDTMARSAPGDQSELVGQSVAINGCCLTVVQIDGRNWSFQAGAETLTKTNLGRLAKNDPVNLERALPADGRLGGHFVQGHVDGVGNVAAIARDGDWVTMRFTVAEQLAAQMVPKGSVAIDGVSLTLVDVGRDGFSVALIPHTLETTTLGTRTVGAAVNIETDILGKYVQKMMSCQQSAISFQEGRVADRLADG